MYRYGEIKKIGLIEFGRASSRVIFPFLYSNYLNYSSDPSSSSDVPPLVLPSPSSSSASPSPASSEAPVEPTQAE
jgi:hypothetical protein